MRTNLEYSSRRTVDPTRARTRKVVMMRSLRERVRIGDVETVNSTVVGDGRRVRR